MVFDLQRAMRASHWRANKRSFPATPELDQSVLLQARNLHLAAAYDRCIEVLQSEPDWQADPRAWRLVGLCWHGLAQYEADSDRRRELYELSEQAHATDRKLRLTECAKADVNLAGALISQQRYDEAMALALRAREADHHLTTAHIAILAIHIRRRQQTEVTKYVQHLFEHEYWIFEDEAFKERLENDPDLSGLATTVANLPR